MEDPSNELHRNLVKAVYYADCMQRELEGDHIAPCRNNDYSVLRSLHTEAISLLYRLVWLDKPEEEAIERIISYIFNMAKDYAGLF